MLASLGWATSRSSRALRASRPATSAAWWPGRAGAQRAVLFGSYARGTADAASDLDLLIVCETERAFLERFRLFPEILEAFPGAELLVYTPSELEAMRARGGFVAQVEREGLVLYGEARAPTPAPAP